MKYCGKCFALYADNMERCPECGKRLRDGKEDDLIFLTEQNDMWTGVLCQILDDQKIPYMKRPKFGAGITATLGSLSERWTVLVPANRIGEAIEIVSQIFADNPMNDTPEDEDASDGETPDEEASDEETDAAAEDGGEKADGAGEETDNNGKNGK